MGLVLFTPTPCISSTVVNAIHMRSIERVEEVGAAMVNQGSPGKCPSRKLICMHVKRDQVAVERWQTSEVRPVAQSDCRLRRCSWFDRRKKKLKRYRQSATVLRYNAFAIGITFTDS